MNGNKRYFWEQRYVAGTTPWDFGGVPQALSTYLQQTSFKGSALIPGCGFGHEVRAFHEAAWEILAIDFSPAAVAQAKQKLGSLAPLVREADFFRDDLGGPYDLIYERTFLCAIPLNLRPLYVERMRQLLRPGGMLVGLFYYGEDLDGPPHPLTDLASAKALFEGFELIADKPVPANETLPMFIDHERWQEWRLL